MPAASEKQRRFMGAVLAAKRGGLKKPGRAVKEAAAGMTEDQVEDFATKSRTAVRKQAAASVPSRPSGRLSYLRALLHSQRRP